MNSRPSFVTRLIALCLLAAVSFSAAAAELGARVMCFGVDGHVALEAAQGAGCAEQSASDAGHGAAFESAIWQASHCGDCVDVVLSHAQASLGKTTHYRPWLVTPLTSAALPVVAPIRLALARHRSAIPFSRQANLPTTMLTLRRVMVIQV